MEEFIGNYFGFLVTMPLAMKVLYKTAGLKKLGMDKTVAEAIKNPKLTQGFIDTIKTSDKNLTIKEAIENLSKEKNITKEAREEIKALKSLSGKGLPFTQKVAKFFGRVLGVGLEKVPAVTKMQKAGNFLKGFGGGAMRFGIIMFAIAPLLTKPFMWLSHSIFGTPTASKEENKAKEANQATNTNNQAAVNNTQTSPFVNQNQNAAPAPAQTSTANNPQEPVRTYIPSPEPAVFPAQQNSKVDSAINRSDSILNYANGVMQNQH
jgi:hypothetical protein